MNLLDRIIDLYYNTKFQIEDWIFARKYKIHDVTDLTIDPVAKKPKKKAKSKKKKK